MTTLLVHYLPRGDASMTGVLANAVREAVPAGERIEVDLVRDPPPFFDDHNVDAYIRRNYLGQEISPADQTRLAGLDRYLEPVLAADTLVVAAPMYNFSLPAAVKAWFDAVMQKGRTWTIDDAGFRGLMTGRSALALTTTGSRFAGERAAWDHFTPLVRHSFLFMGYDPIDIIAEGGMNSEPDTADDRITAAAARVRTLLEAWNQSRLQPLEA